MIIELIVWFVIFIGLIVIEALTADLLTVWFIPGALVSIILASFEVPVPVQILAFFGVSAVMFVLFKTVLKDRFVSKKKEKTNIDMIIGQTGVVLEDIDNLSARGSVKVNFNIWTARSCNDDDIIRAGDKVEITAVEGVKLICRKID